jgi:NADP-dependent 3-hydroxy acid dehydrogenase YdfG
MATFERQSKMSQNLELSGKVAIVTGASSGIGAATVQELLSRGASVVAVGRRADRLQALAAGDRAGERLLIQAGDINQRQFVSKLIETATAWRGHLDFLVNNAGVSLGTLNEASNVDDFELMLDTNVLALANLARCATPALRASKGTMVNVSSTAVMAALPGGAVYSASKAAVATFSESIRKELAPHDVRVVTVYPGLVDTELFDNFEEKKKAEFAKVRAAIEVLKPIDVARVIVFALCQPPHVALNEIVVRPTRQIP